MARASRNLTIRFDDSHQADLIATYLAKAARGGRIDPALTDGQNAMAEMNYQVSNMIRRDVRAWREDARGSVPEIDATAG